MGRIRRSWLQPATGFGLVVGTRDGAIEDADAALLAELDVDLVLRARFRVGLHEGKASVQRGSIVTVLGADVMGSAESTRSLLGDEVVEVGVDPDGPTSIRHRVDEARFLDSLRPVFARYVLLGLDG